MKWEGGGIAAISLLDITDGLLKKESYTYMSQMLYAGQSDQENVTFFTDF